jgi:hypothetical protein
VHSVLEHQPRRLAHPHKNPEFLTLGHRQGNILGSGAKFLCLPIVACLDELKAAR